MFLRRVAYSYSIKPQYSHIQELKSTKEVALSQMKAQYPHILISKELTAKMAYMLRHETPEQVIARGGFVAKSAEIWLANLTGDNQDPYKNKGSICLTLLPEITSIFLSNRSINHKKCFIYAIPLDECVLLGGQWRQILSPGALPLPSVWRCREVLKTNNGKAILGPILGDGCESLVIPGEKYAAYLHDGLNIPKGIGISADYPEIYDIKDTPMTENFQNRVNKHYQEALCGDSKKLSFKSS